MSASLKGKKGNIIDIKKETNKMKNEKEKSQPSKIKTGGSTFKNPIYKQIKKFGSLLKSLFH